MAENESSENGVFDHGRCICKLGTGKHSDRTGRIRLDVRHNGLSGLCNTAILAYPARTSGQENKTMKTIRQGDVFFIPVEKADKIDAESFRKDGIIQEGEATGHHHKLAVLEDAEVFRPNYGNAMVSVGPNGVSIIHEEHGPVTLEPNTTYKVHIAREFDYLADMTRSVRD